jgi:hypothetical protein
MRALHAEFRKLITTRTGYWLTILSMLISILFTILISLNVDKTDSASDALQTIITTSTGFSYTFAAILGIIGLTGEYRHQTVTPTFLSVPMRSEVVGAKIICYLIWGALMGVLNLIVTVALGLPLLKHRLFVDVSLSAHGVHSTMISAIVISAIFGIIGVGVGALVRNQAAAIVILVLYLFLIENILSAIHAVQKVYTYLPGALASALTGAVNQPSGVHLLHRTPAALLLIAYGIAFALVGAVLTVRRDVT